MADQIIYRTREGDTVDLICWHVYGRTSGTVEQVYEANPGLAAKGPIIPVGTLVTLPTISDPQAEGLVTLW
jgi:phage tail protein X